MYHDCYDVIFATWSKRVPEWCVNM